MHGTSFCLFFHLFGGFFMLITCWMIAWIMNGGMGKLFEGRGCDLLTETTEILSEVSVLAVMQTVLPWKISERCYNLRQLVSCVFEQQFWIHIFFVAQCSVDWQFVKLKCLHVQYQILADGSGGESSGSDESQQGPATSSDSAPESDATPHMNIGPQFQCSIPQWNPDREKANREPSYEHLLWDPGISKFCTDAEGNLSVISLCLFTMCACCHWSRMFCLPICCLET